MWATHEQMKWAHLFYQISIIRDFLLPFFFLFFDNCKKNLLKENKTNSLGLLKYEVEINRTW